MTNRKPVTEQEALAKLYQALNTPDDLSHAEAHKLLPALIEAEQAGQDVDTDPRFAVLLRHLENCSECLDLYERLSEDVEALIGAAEVLPPPPQAAPDFFKTVLSNESFVLRIFEGLKRMFTLDLARPSLASVSGVLSGGQRETLLSYQITDLPGSPHVVVALERAAQGLKLLVAVRESKATRRWKVQLQVDEHTYTAETNERGIAQFSEVSAAQIKQADRLNITCSEADTTAGAAR